MNPTSSEMPIWLSASGSIVMPRPAPLAPVPFSTTGGSWSIERSAIMSLVSFCCVWSPLILSAAPRPSIAPGPRTSAEKSITGQPFQGVETMSAGRAAASAMPGDQTMRQRPGMPSGPIART